MQDLRRSAAPQLEVWHQTVVVRHRSVRLGNECVRLCIEQVTLGIECVRLCIEQVTLGIECVRLCIEQVTLGIECVRLCIDRLRLRDVQRAEGTQRTRKKARLC